MIFLRDNTRITKEQAFEYIRSTAKHAYNQDYTDDKIESLFSDKKYHSIVCIDHETGERFAVTSLVHNCIIHETVKQGRLF